MAPQIPPHVVRRIERYSPGKAEVRAALQDSDLLAIRSAVRAAGPEDLSKASRMLSHAAAHVAWVRQNMPDLPGGKLFGSAAVTASVQAAKAAPGNASPFCSDLRAISAATGPKTAVTVPCPIAQPDPLRPYSSGEQQSLIAITRGMDPDEARSLRAGVVLGIGAGLIGAPAARVSAERTAEVCGQTLVWSEPAGAWIPVGHRWVPLLREAIERAPQGSLSSMYSSDGRLRLQRRLERATARPEVSSHRARNTWLAELLAAGVPVDVLAHQAGVLPSTLLRHLPLAPNCPACARRSLHGDVRGPAASFVAALADSLPDPPAPFVPTAHPEAERDFTDLAPIDEKALAIWEGGVGAALTKRAWTVSDDPGRVRDLLCAASALVTWSATIISIPGTLDALLRQSTIERWERATRTSIPDATRTTYRSRLRSLAGLTSRGGSGHGNQSLPYSDKEQADLADVRDSLPQPTQVAFDAIWHAGLGAGADASTGKLTGADVRSRANGTVEIRGRSAWVVAHRDHQEALAALAAAAEHGPLGGGRRRVDHLKAHLETAGVALDPGRLRATWLFRHLAAGVALPALVTAAGSKFASIDTLCSQIPARTPAERLAWMIHADLAAGCDHRDECTEDPTRH